jgi:hypothetical protein
MFHTCGCVAQPGTQTQTAEEVKYTLYIGLNDKNTYTQLLSTEDAVNRVADIALKYVDGFTQLSGKGAYKDEKGIITHENCLIFEFYDTNEEQIKAIMDEVLQELNQNSRLDPLSLENIHLKHFLYLKLLCFRAAALDMGPLVSMFHRASQGQLQLTLCGPLPKAG